MKKILLFLGLAAVAAASVTIPVQSPDGTLVTGSSIGRPVVAYSGETWLVCGNDNPGGGDLDFNEPCASAVFGTNTFDLTFLFTATAHFNTLGVVGQAWSVGPTSPLATFNYTPGVEIPFDQFDQTLNVHFYSGSFAVGPEANVWAQCVFGCPEIDDQGQVPEPGTWVSALTGLGLMGFYAIKRKVAA
jgi:hypothetical protein